MWDHGPSDVQTITAVCGPRSSDVQTMTRMWDHGPSDVQTMTAVCGTIVPVDVLRFE
jgi:hypothetical protein